MPKKKVINEDEELTEDEIKYWRSRANEPLGFVRVSKERQEEINKTLHLPTKEELDQIEREYEGKE